MIPIYEYGQVADSDIFARYEPRQDVGATVAAILEDVRRRGDTALREYTLRFDGADLESLRVTDRELAEAEVQVSPRLLEILKRAAENIRAFHSCQVRTGFSVTREGVVLGQRITPVDRAGLYVPGGTAAYPSTVLMDAIPAKIAGCPEVMMVTPPGKDGKIAPAILAAARVAGVDKIFKVGGAQAIAALAYGTESVPRADKIVGPGNAYVAEAKRQVSGLVGIDMIAGPSEILIVADGASDPQVVAADLLSQAEHDKLASAVLVTDSKPLALAVQQALEQQIPKLLRAPIARASIDQNGKIILTRDLSQAVDVANRIAPEHLELCVEDPFRWLGRVKHAGSVFLGRSCPEAVGDYMAGPNHTLPTSGTARFSSPLGVDDFIKKTQYCYFSPEAMAAISEDVALFAETEGLTAHAASARARQEASL